MKKLEAAMPVIAHLAFAMFVLFAPELSYAALPWEKPVVEFGNSLSGPVARYGALIALVVFGLLVAFGEAKGLVGNFARVMFGLSFALMAGSWVSYFGS